MDHSIKFSLRFQEYKKDGKTIRPKTDPTILMMVFDSRFAGRKFAYSTKRSINKSDWNKTKGFPKDVTNLSPLRSHLKELQTETSNWMDSKAGSISLDKEQLKGVLDRVGKDELKEKANLLLKETDLFDIWEKIINSTKHPKTGLPISESTKSTKRQTMALVKKYSVEKNFKPTLQNLDLDFYHAFDEYMQTKYDGNTRGKHFKEIKAFLKECVERDYENVNKSFTKKAFRVIKEDVDDVYWTKEDIQKLIKLEKEKLKGDEAELCAHMIVASLTGLRFSDWGQHDPANIVVHNDREMFKAMQQKTGTAVYIPLHPVVKMYLNKYGKMRTISNQKMNEYVKEFCNAAEFSDKKKAAESSCHTARRTFCTLAYLSKMPMHTIMAVSGHKSTKSFERYLKLGPLEHAILAAESNFFTEDWTQGLKVVA